jgi:hypothetical protein
MTTYDDYKRALTMMRDLPGRTSTDLEQARQAHTQASALADRAASAADASASGAITAVEAQLNAARAVVAPLGRSNLIPPRIRPSGGVSRATRDDVIQAQQALAVAVNQLREAVSGEMTRMQAESARLAREAADRERMARQAAERAAARRKRHIQFGAAGVLVLLLLVVIVIIA